jgi:prepilin signal peptidase PulO-like enzyme (type II secretory pathway)
MDIQSLAQLPFWFTSLIVGLLGLTVGSFVNVVIYRVPRQMSIVSPGSHCPNCATPLRATDNIPLLSFLLLTGRCRSCGATISLRYPIVELLVCLLFWVVWRADGLSWSLLLDWTFVTAMVALGAIDLEHRLLPDMITYPGFVLAVGLRGVVPGEAALPWVSLSEAKAPVIGAGLIASSGFLMLAIEWLDFYFIGRRHEESEETPASSDSASSYGKYLAPVTVILGFLLAGVFLLMTLGRDGGVSPVVEPRVKSILGAWAGMAVGAGLIWGLRLAYFAVKKIEGAGFGDVKMMMLVGAYLGWPRTFLTLLVASVLGALVGLVVVIRHRNRYLGIPYGIFLAAAAVASLLIGTPVVRWYWRFYQL